MSVNCTDSEVTSRGEYIVLKEEDDTSTTTDLPEGYGAPTRGPPSDKHEYELPLQALDDGLYSNAAPDDGRFASHLYQAPNKPVMTEDDGYELPLTQAGGNHYEYFNQEDGNFASHVYQAPITPRRSDGYEVPVPDADEQHYSTANHEGDYGAVGTQSNAYVVDPSKAVDVNAAGL